MQFSPKATRFIIEAIEFYQKDHEARLQATDISEDEVADIANDHQYYEVLKGELQQHYDELFKKSTD
jgi:hypothetical protein